MLIRYHERSTSERVNSLRQDEFCGSYIRVRGHAKIFCHLTFGIDVVMVYQLMRFVT